MSVLSRVWVRGALGKRRAVRKWVGATVLGVGVGVAAAQPPQGSVPLPAIPSIPSLPPAQTPPPPGLPAGLPPIPIDPPDAPVSGEKPAGPADKAPPPREPEKPGTPAAPMIPPAAKVEIPVPPVPAPAKPPEASRPMPAPSEPAPPPMLPPTPPTGRIETTPAPGTPTAPPAVRTPPPAAGQPAAGPPTQAGDPARAADPLGVMLAEGKAALGKVRDYTCTFTRQERINGVLSAEQVAEMRVRSQPYSVYVRFARPEAVAGLELCYVTGKQFGKVRVHPKAADRFVSVSVDDPKLLAEHRHPANELGVGPLLDRLTGIATRERVLNNPVEVYTSDYQFAGRNVTRYEIFTRRPHAHRYAHRMLVYVDKETKLPVRWEAYDAPKPGTTVGELLEAYSYTDLKPNVGLGNSAFDY